MRRLSALVCTALLSLSGPLAFGDDGTRLLTIDHYVKVRSMATSIAGQDAQLYVREVVVAGPALRTRAPSQPVVLFVHGAGTPAEVAFDSSPEGYSWMAHLARAGFDTFAVDMTGYGRSTRPAAMNDPCNVARESQDAFIPQLLKAPCTPTRSEPITTMESDWHDIDAVVEQLRALRGVDKVSLVAWSQGGPRAGGYAAQPGQDQPAGGAGSCLPARRTQQSTPAAAGRGYSADDHTVTSRVHGQLGQAGRLCRSVPKHSCRRHLGRSARLGCRRAPPGAAACGVHRKYRPGASTARS